MKEIVTELKERWPINCVWAEETGLIVTKVQANCAEQYNRETYLSNGSRREPTKPYVDFNKGRKTGRPKRTIELELD